jgi:hypothetical protein
MTKGAVHVVVVGGVGDGVVRGDPSVDLYAHDGRLDHVHGSMDAFCARLSLFIPRSPPSSRVEEIHLA